ncbi:MAG: methyltransferase domain-containing protein [Planctomycetes bacterium]|nr:methyltransferase domain-containing protein [Planctomycetota bacterium]
MTTREDVVNAYRMLLGREPEDEAVVERLRSASPDVKSLRERFLASTEFQQRYRLHMASRVPRPPRNSPPMAVDLDVPAPKLARLFAKTGKQWLHLGETEPHWSVLTHEAFRQERLGDTREAFYRSGATDVAAMMAAAERSGVPMHADCRVLELGCGVGRITAHMARVAREVVGVDISPAHLQLARAYAEEQRLRNVRFELLRSVDALPTLGSFDVVFTVIVLQHNPPPVMARLLRDMLSVLRPGGLAYFQVPTYRIGYRFRIDDYLAQENETEMEMHVLPQAALFELLRASGCRLLELREDDAIGQPEVSISNTLLVQKQTRA